MTYDVHAPNTDARAALDDTAPLSVWGTDSNVLSTSAYTRGADFDEGVRGERVHRARDVPDAADRARVPRAGVDASRSRPATAATGRCTSTPAGRACGTTATTSPPCSTSTPTRVTVELVSNGGAFGGKEDMSNQAQTALAAWKLGRPVKCTLSREESFRMHAKRHPIELEYWAGCDADGKVTALKVRGIGDSGAYASVGMKVLERAAGHACGPYRWPSLDIETIAVRTNNLVCGAFRGFGANQAQFAMEGVLDRLAEQVGISGWEIRKRNVIKPGEEWGPGQIMDDGAGGAEACLDQIKAVLRRGDRGGQGGRARPRAEELRARQRLPRGVEGGHPVPRAGRRRAGRIEVRHGWTEMGQGVHTVALQVAAQELGVDPDRIDVIVDTTRELGFGQTTGSRGTLMVAGSVSDAAAAALAGGCEIDVDYEGEYVVDWTQKLGDPSVANPTIHAVFSFAAQMVIADPGDRRHREGRRGPRRRQGGQPDARRGPGRGLGAHGARVRADRGVPDRSRRPASRPT